MKGWQVAAVAAIGGLVLWSFGSSRKKKGATVTTGTGPRGISTIVPNEAVYGFDAGFPVQSHLDAMGSVLAHLRLTESGKVTTWPLGRAASDIITDVARRHNVKPQYLIVSLDREQGLVSGGASRLGKPGMFSETSAGLQKALDWATGYAVPDTGGRDPKWQGFTKQLEGAASAANRAMRGEGSYAAAKNPNGKLMKLLDGYATPTNTATAMLYVYTPHADVGQANRTLYLRHAPELVA